MQSELRTTKAKAKDVKHEAMRKLREAYLRAKEQDKVQAYKVVNA